MSSTRRAAGSLTSLAALALLTAGCSGTAVGARTGGCRDDAGWSARQRAAWLRPAVSFYAAATGQEPAVRIRPRAEGDGGALCLTVPVQVEFWKTEAGGVRSVLRVRLGLDGSTEHTVGFPSGLTADERDACTGVLVAAYVGAPLADDELPEASALTNGSGTAEAVFRTDRIGAYRMIPASDPQRCDADPGETPTTTPSGSSAPSPSSAPSNPWGLGHR